MSQPNWWLYLFSLFKFVPQECVIFLKFLSLSSYVRRSPFVCVLVTKSTKGTRKGKVTTLPSLRLFHLQVSGNSELKCVLFDRVH